MTTVRQHLILHEMQALANEYNKIENTNITKVGIGVVVANIEEIDLNLKCMALIVSEGNCLTKNRYEERYENLEQKEENTWTRKQS